MSVFTSVDGPVAARFAVRSWSSVWLPPLALSVSVLIVCNAVSKDSVPATTR